MNRRDFFKAALGLLGAAVLPGEPLAASAGEFVSIDAARRAVAALAHNEAAILNDGWVVLFHPDIDIVHMTAKLEWKRAYRQARMELKKMAKDWVASGEIGRVESFRFIRSVA